MNNTACFECGNPMNNTAYFECGNPMNNTAGGASSVGIL